MSCLRSRGAVDGPAASLTRRQVWPPSPYDLTGVGRNPAALSSPAMGQPGARAHGRAQARNGWDTQTMRVDPGPGSAAHDATTSLAAALAASRTGTWRWDAASGEVRWDATLEALSGLQPGEFGSTFEA